MMQEKKAFIDYILGPEGTSIVKANGYIPDESLRYIQPDVNDYYSESPHSKLRIQFSSCYKYLLHLYPKDAVLKQNISLIARYASSRIIAAYEHARKHKATKFAIILGTAHSTKGLEFDEVTLADDLNESLDDIISNFRTDPTYSPSVNERTELNLYYVACSRARKFILNARHLPGQ